ncbi:putative membrane protein [Rickettsia amblyommatis str. Darkwater]|uniref:Putative membrane protein n=1 Tax=Rickettsia amblyommatis str. Ac/Pa TaxID=1359164 RepID=A0A0F3N469_RICAM|nr:putative membrane protein [Rickettsia amblyommatis str. Ac/Pa]KJV90693.1 putative membrane protein [Rickettsia amblyommatis str. Darkwater]KJW00046.1 putative membrane protein [Rickettsia amblyommatis str. Darkwater]
MIQDPVVKPRYDIEAFYWIPAFAGMIIKYIIDIFVTIKVP